MKILVLGDHQSGKTSVIKRYVYDYYSAQYKPTVGVDFHLKPLKIDGTDFNVSFWDIVGADKAGSVAKVYYRKATGILLVCDCKDPQFDNLAKWRSDVNRNIKLPNGQVLPVVLMVNKADRQRDSDEIDREEFDSFCERENIAAWFDTSAKENGHNISAAVNELLNCILSSDKCVVKQHCLPDEDEITFEIPAPTPLTSVFGWCGVFSFC